MSRNERDDEGLMRSLDRSAEECRQQDATIKHISKLDGEAGTWWHLVPSFPALPLHHHPRCLTPNPKLPHGQLIADDRYMTLGVLDWYGQSQLTAYTYTQSPHDTGA